MSSLVVEWIERNMTSQADTAAIVALTMTSPELNETFPLCPKEKECKVFLVVVNVYILLTMFVLGFIGNTLSFLVLRSDENNATFILKVMAVIDNLFIVVTGFAQAYVTLTIDADPSEYGLSYYLQVFVWPWVHITQLCNVWITVLLALYRFIAICFPFEHDEILPQKRITKQVYIMIALVVLYNVPRFFEHSLTSVEEPDPRNESLENPWVNASDTTDTGPNMYSLVYTTILYCIVVYFIPLVLLSIFNASIVASIVIKLCRDEDGRPLRREDTKELSNITRVMLIIIVVFIVTQTPASVNQPLYYLIGRTEYCCSHAYFYYYHISNLFASSYSCINFIIYCACRRKFRAVLWKLVCNSYEVICRVRPKPKQIETKRNSEKQLVEMIPLKNT